MNIVTEIPSLVFSSQLAEIHIKDVLEIMTFSILLGNETIFSESFVPDTKSEIVISGVNDIIGAELLEEPIRDFKFKFEAGEETKSYECRVMLSKGEIDANARHFLHQRFLTTLIGEKYILPSSHEYLYVYPLRATSYKITASYRDIESRDYEQAVHNGTNLVINKINALDVSPYLFERKDKLLVKYTVECGYRKMTYYVDHLHKTTDLEVIFINNFGVAETFATRATLQSEDIYDNQFGRIRGKYQKLHIDQQREYTANTGFMSQETASWLADNLFSSLNVHRIENRKIEKKITITDQTVKRSSEDTELPSFDFKYQLEQSAQLILKFRHLLRSVWDKTFDKTFRGDDTYK